MADIFTVKSPLMLRFSDGTERLVAELYPHQAGAVVLPVFWLSGSEPNTILLEGEWKGDGPWKVGDVIIRLLSCGDVELSMQWASWQQELAVQSSMTAGYHDNTTKRKLLLAAGALL